MRKYAKFLALCLASCFCALSISVPGFSASSNSVDVATGFNLSHPVVRRVLQPWADEVRRKTAGSIDMRFYNPGLKVPVREHFNALQKGELGIAHAAVSLNQGKLAVTSLMDLPSLMTDCLSASEAFWNLFQSSPEMQDEFKGIKILAIHAMPPHQLNLINGNISSLADFKSQKILTSPNGDSARLLKALGANPLITPVADFSSSLSRNLADGCLLPLGTLRAEKLQENLQSITVCDLRMDCYWLGMNMDAYNALPEAARQSLDELSGLELSMAIARVLNDLNNLALLELSKEEISINHLQPEERVRWINQLGQPIKENWLRQLKRKQIVNGPEIWNRAQDIYREAHDKWGHRAGQQITPGS